jgi:hypothetical protein
VKSTSDEIPIAPVGIIIRIEAVILAPLDCGTEINNATAMPITTHETNNGRLAIIVSNPLNIVVVFFNKVDLCYSCSCKNQRNKYCKYGFGYHLFYCALHPPSTGIAVPVMRSACCEARNTHNAPSDSVDTNFFTACFTSITLAITSSSLMLCVFA